MAPPDDLRRIIARAHDVLALLLILLRPSIWDGESAAWPTLIWYGLLTIALALLATEALAGHRPTARWGWSGVVAATLMLVLLPAAWHGPEGYEAWALWAQWAGHLVLAGYLLQIAPGRNRLLLAALVAGLTAQICYALGQAAWSLPHLAQQASAGTLGVGGLQADLQERIANGGVFGSFTVSNGLAAFLILALPVVAGVAWRGKHPAPRVIMGVLLIATVVVLILSRSKGAIATLGTATLITALWHGSTRWRAAAAITVVVGGLLTWAIPTVRDGVMASANVRWGYWQGAAELIAEEPLSGHGIGGFAAHAARVLPIGAEYSRYVHNEILEATVAGGLLAGVLAAGLLLLLVRRPRPEVDTEHEPVPHPALLLITPLVALPYLHVFGLLPGEGWPGAVNGLAFLPILGISALAGGAAWAATRLPAPPAWALHLGLLACLGHALIDFDFHAGGVVGSVVVVAVLAAHGRTKLITGRGWRPVPALIVVIMAISLVRLGGHGRALTDARNLVLEVEALPHVARSDPPRFADLLTHRHHELGLPPPTPAQATPRALADLLVHTVRHALPIVERWPPANPSARVGLIGRLPVGAQRLPLTQEFAAACPWLASAHRLLAEDLVATNDHAGAIASIRRAIACAPWHLPHQQALARLLRAQGDADEAAVVEARIVELTPRVYFRDQPQDIR